MTKNEPDFLNFLKAREMNLMDPWGFPKIRGILLKHPDEVNMIGFNYATNPATKDKENLWVHFFLPDYRFQQVWNHPENYIDCFKQYRGIVSPDFSMYVGMAKAMQLFQVYRMAFLTSYYQQHGIKVIPSVTWAEKDTFDWCFSWIPKGSAVVCSTVGCVQNKDARRAFLVGYEEMLARVQPSSVIIYGHEIPEATEMYPDFCRVPDMMEVRKKTALRGEPKHWETIDMIDTSRITDKESSHG